MNFIEIRTGRCPKCAQNDIKHLKKEYHYSTPLNIEGLYVIMTFQCRHCAYIYQEVFECVYRFTQEPSVWRSDFYQYPTGDFEDVDDLACDNCGILWGRSSLMRKNRDKCPFCGSQMIRHN